MINVECVKSLTTYVEHKIIENGCDYYDRLQKKEKDKMERIGP